MGWLDTGRSTRKGTRPDTGRSTVQTCVLSSKANHSSIQLCSLQWRVAIYLLPLPLYSKSRAYHQQLAMQRCNVPKQHSTIPAYPQVPSCQCMVYCSPKSCTTRRICLAEWPSRYVSPFPFPLFPQHAIPVRHPVGSGGQPIFCPR
jgi:hypothetical protein